VDLRAGIEHALRRVPPLWVVAGNALVLTPELTCVPCPGVELADEETLVRCRSMIPLLVVPLWTVPLLTDPLLTPAAVAVWVVAVLGAPP
jgi:hypothetical protein